MRILLLLISGCILLAILTRHLPQRLRMVIEILAPYILGVCVFLWALHYIPFFLLILLVLFVYFTGARCYQLFRQLLK